MKILQNHYLFNCLDLPTVEWKQYFPSTELDNELLWTIKIESKNTVDKPQKKKKDPIQKFISSIPMLNERRQTTYIGIDADSAQKIGNKFCKKLGTGEIVLYYPYYTVVKSGIIDINAERTVIEASKGSIQNLIKENNVDITMIFKDDDLEIVGDDKFFDLKESIELVDCCKSIKKSCARDIDSGKNLQFYWSFVYKTNVYLKPEKGLKLIFFHYKIF